jgi:isopentenyl-diphosphate delta-isomerase
MSDTTNLRKAEVLDIIRNDPETDRRARAFDAIRLRPRALPERDAAQVDPSVTFLGKRLSFPLLISSMTGGDHEVLRTINRRLAEAAEITGVALGVGSQRVLFTHPGSRPAFELRAIAPTTLLFANLGAVQLNYGFGLKEARAAVECLGADGLYLHLNPLQEAVQPEGNTNFAGLARKIGEVAAGLPVPVLLKEVGAGLSRADVELALAHGVRIFDVAGTGGTSWSRIENHRRRATFPDDLGLTFQDWGLPTPEALRELAPLRDRATLIASGGIRSGIDMVKALILGASLCGVAGPFLAAATDSVGSVVKTIERLKREFVTALFLLGAGTAGEVIGRDDLILPPSGFSPD